MPSVDVDER